MTKALTKHKSAGKCFELPPVGSKLKKPLLFTEERFFKLLNFKKQLFAENFI